MTEVDRVSRRGLVASIGAVAALAAASVVMHTWNGASVNGDAVRYVSVAENFADGNGLRTFNDVWHTAHPPGFAIVLAGLELLGLSARSATRWLNAVLYGGTILFAGLWLRSVCRYTLAVVAALIAMASSLAWHTTASGYYSEPLYLLLAFGSLALISSLLRTPPRNDLWLILAAGTLAGASAVTRWIGAVVILSSFLVVLGAAKDRRPPKTRLRLACLYGFVAALPLAVVLGLNAAHSDHIVGHRSTKSPGSLTDSIEQILRLQDRPQFVIAWLMLLIVLAAALVGRRESGLGWLRLDRSLPFAAFGCVYLVAIVFTQGLTNDPINERFLLPAWLAFLVVACELADKALSPLPAGDLIGRLRPATALLGAGAVSAVLLLSVSSYGIRPASVLLSRVEPASQDPTNTAEIHDSDLFDYLDDNPIDGLLHSNRPNALYWIADRRPVKGITEAEGQACVDWFNSVKPQHIVWFADPDPGTTPRCDMTRVEEALPWLQAVHRSEDGVIYRRTDS